MVSVTIDGQPYDLALSNEVIQLFAADGIDLQAVYQRLVDGSHDHLDHMWPIVGALKAGGFPMTIWELLHAQIDGCPHAFAIEILEDAKFERKAA